MQPDQPDQSEQPDWGAPSEQTAGEQVPRERWAAGPNADWATAREADGEAAPGGTLTEWRDVAAERLQGDVPKFRGGRPIEFIWNDTDLTFDWEKEYGTKVATNVGADGAKIEGEVNPWKEYNPKWKWPTYENKGRTYREKSEERGESAATTAPVDEKVESEPESEEIDEQDQFELEDAPRFDPAERVSFDTSFR